MWKKLNGSNCFERNETAQSVDVKETERLNLFERNWTAQSVDVKETERLKLFWKKLNGSIC